MEEPIVDGLDARGFQQQVDPAVSRVKFTRELEAFKKIEEYNRQRGVVLIEGKFPLIKLAFYAYRIRPLILAFAIKLDFTNYDLEPPSLKFIDLLTEKELVHPELNIQFVRFQMIQQGNGIAVPQPLIDLIQSHQPQKIPFVCMPGVREYHKHPAHSNDSWLSRKGKGEGTLGFVIDQLHKYGTEPLNAIIPKAVNVNPVNPSAMMVQFQGILFLRDKSPL